ncbi:MAG: hypothetical protein NVS3B26_02570 [Mycobacteriales bacterium]
MPETTFAVRWPDGAEQTYYSPSLVVHEFLESGQAYEVGELIRLTQAAMTEASERVRTKHGFACTRAAATLQYVQAHGSGYRIEQTATVVSR